MNACWECKLAVLTVKSNFSIMVHVRINVKKLVPKNINQFAVLMAEPMATIACSKSHGALLASDLLIEGFVLKTIYYVAKIMIQFAVLMEKPIAPNARLKSKDAVVKSRLSIEDFVLNI